METIILNKEYLTKVARAFFDEALNPQVKKVPRNMRSERPNTVLYNSSFTWGDITCSMEYRQVTTGDNKNVNHRFFWELKALSSEEEPYKCPQKSPDDLFKRMLIRSPKKPLICVFAHFLRTYIGKEYLYLIVGKDTFVDISTEHCIEILKEKYREACYYAFAKPPLHAPTVKVSKMISSDNAFPDLESFQNNFFTAHDDASFVSNIDRFNQICRIWNVKYNPGGAQIEEVALLFGNPSSRKSIREKILFEAFRFPLLSSLLESRKYNELHDLLRELCTIDISLNGDENIINPIILPPAQAIADRVLNPAIEKMRGRDYTVYDYILVLGKYAEMAGRVRNVHHFSSIDVDECDKPYIEDAIKNKLLEQTDDDSGTHYSFRLKQMRIYCAASSRALSDIERWRSTPTYSRVQEGLSALLDTRGTEKEEAKNVDVGHASRHFSAESFYAVCYIEATDSIHRKDLIDGLISVANNFHVDKDHRIRQEKAISILSYLLLEKGHEFPRVYLEKVFDAAFSKTLFKFQGEMWSQIKQRSAYYANHAKNCFASACKLIEPNQIGEEYSLPQGYNNKVSAAQPYFNFLQADLYTESEMASASDALKVFLKCCNVQRDTWFLSPENSSISSSFVHNAFLLIEICLEQIKKYPDGDDSLYYVYGLNHLFYGLANLKYQNMEDQVYLVQKALSDSEFKPTRLLEAVILCDYWNRRRNFIYDLGLYGKDYFLLAGPIRLVCSYDLSQMLEGPVLLESLGVPDIRNRYQKYLAFQKKDLRYYYLMLRLLSYTDFDVRSYMNRSDYTNFEPLPYDNLPREYSLFYNSPHQIQF